MERVGLSGELWCNLVRRFGKIFERVAGKAESLAEEASLRGQLAVSSKLMSVLIVLPSPFFSPPREPV